MQSKFNSYTKELDDIRQKLSNCPQVLNISSKNFSQYQSLIKRKEFLQNQIFNSTSIDEINDKLTPEIISKFPYFDKKSMSAVGFLLCLRVYNMLF